MAEGSAGVISTYNKKIDFDVDLKKKRQIKKALLRYTPCFRWQQLASRLILAGFLAGAAIYGGLNIFIPSWSIVNVGGVPVKDHMSILLNVLILCFFGGLIYLFWRGLLQMISGRQVDGRQDEELWFADGKLHYMFRLTNDSDPRERNIVELGADSIDRIIVNEQTGKLLFEGSFFSAYMEFDNQKNKVMEMQPVMTDHLELYDYFVPGLLEALENMGSFTIIRKDGRER